MDSDLSSFEGQVLLGFSQGLVVMLVPIVYNSFYEGATERFAVEKLSAHLPLLTVLGHSPVGQTFEPLKTLNRLFWKMVFTRYFYRKKNGG